MLLSSDSDYDSYSTSSPSSSSSENKPMASLDASFELTRSDSAEFEIEVDDLDEVLAALAREPNQAMPNQAMSRVDGELAAMEIEHDIQQMLAAEATMHTSKRKWDDACLQDPSPNPNPKRQTQHHIQLAPICTLSETSAAARPVLPPPAIRAAPSLSCEVVQGEKDRQAAPDNAWLRSMNRLTYFNSCLELHDKALAQQIARALVNPSEDNLSSDQEVALSCCLLYADNMQPVGLRTEGATKEVLSVITKKGTTKDGATELHSNSIDLSSQGRGGFRNASASGASDVASTQNYLEVKCNGSTLEFSLKFSTNITSRRHGARNAGRQFRWQITLQVPGLSLLTAHSHSFLYISRPAAAEQPTKAPLSQSAALLLLEVVSDGRPGDLLMCVGRHLQRDDVAAVIGQGTQVLGELARLPVGQRANSESFSTFVTRVPNVPEGTYWVEMQARDPSVEASTRILFRIVSRANALGSKAFV